MAKEDLATGGTLSENAVIETAKKIGYTQGLNEFLEIEPTEEEEV